MRPRLEIVIAQKGERAEVVLGSPVNLLRSTHNRNKYRIYGKRARYEVTDGRNQRRLLLWILSNRAPLLPPTPSAPLPSPPSSRRLCFHRRPARCAVESSRTIHLLTTSPSRDWHRPNRSATAGSFYFYRHRRFNGEEEEEKKTRETATTANIYRGNARPEFSSLKFQIRPP